MKLNIKKSENNKLNLNEIDILIESNINTDIAKLIEYINKYDEKKLIVSQNNELMNINLQDIILFYSDKKNNYCRTNNDIYKVNYKLYELERRCEDFIRISKSRIININHVSKFDIGETGKIVVKLDDNTQEIVSRRKVRLVMEFLEERSL